MLLFMHLFDSFSILKKSSEPMQQPNHDMNPFSFFIYNASDWATGAILLYGPTRETARPVAYDSMQLSPAELNYRVHEKELLAIVRALKK